MIMFGNEVSEKILNDAKNLADGLDLKLFIITNPNDDASKVYVNNKLKKCRECGIKAQAFAPAENSTTEDYIELINRLNKDNSITGIIVQLPLPQGIDVKRVMSAISPEKDVDGFTPNSKCDPCTPKGIIELIEYYKGPEYLKGKNVCIVGRSEIVGKPLARMLLDKDCTVTVCHSKTDDLTYHTRMADIVVCATGKPKMLKHDMVRLGTMVIDVGINRDENGKLCGDSDFETLKYKTDITPVPKGIGLTTVACLVKNVAELGRIAYEDRQNSRIKIK